MGVSAEITFPSQVTANYHKIDSVEEIKWKEDGTGKMQLAISQFLSYEARQSGASPINKTFKTFTLEKELVDVFRFILYKAILPIAPEYNLASPVQDGELGNMLRLLKYLTPAEMAAMIFALTDILAIFKVDPETYRDWYDSLKEDTLSVI